MSAGVSTLSAFRSGEMRLTMLVSTLPAPISTTVSTSSAGQRSDALAPAHHARHLLHQELADGCRVRYRRGGDIGDHRNGGRRNRHLFEHFRKHVSRGLHQSAMKRRADAERHGAADLELLGHRAGAVDRRLAARDHDLPRRIVVGDIEHIAAASPLQQAYPHPAGRHR